MSKEKKYYKTVIEVVVLSEGTYDPSTLFDIANDTVDGDCSGDFDIISSTEVTPKQMCELLIAQGSEPSFLGLDDEEEEDNEE